MVREIRSDLQKYVLSCIRKEYRLRCTLCPQRNLRDLLRRSGDMISQGDVERGVVSSKLSFDFPSFQPISLEALYPSLQRT